VLRAGAPVVLGDAAADAGDARVGAFAGFPLRGADGAVRGAFCAVDARPRAWSPAELETLEDLAALAATATGQMRAEAHYSRLVATSPFIIYVVDAAGEFVEINPAGERLLERPATELLGTHFAHILAPHSQAVAQQAFVDVLSGATNDVQVDLEVVNASGGHRWLAVSASAVRWGQSITGVHGIARDITQERIAAETLRESEEKFQQLAGNVREVFWIFSPDFSRTIYVSPAYERVWGQSLEEVYRDPHSFLASVHPDDRDRLAQAMSTLGEVPVREIEYRVVRPDGGVRWVWSRGFPVLDAEGIMYRLVGTTEDVTERKEAEAAIRATQRRQQQVLDALPVGVVLADAGGELVWHNPEGDRIWGGVRRVSLDGYGEYKGWWTESGEPIQAHEWGMARALRGEPSAGELVDLQGFDGVRRTVRHSGAPLRGEQGEVTGALIVLEDVTEAREQETQRRLLAAALEGLSDGVCLATEEGEIVYANRAFADILGFDSGAGNSLSFADFASGAEMQKEIDDALRAVRELGSWTGRVRRRRLVDGRTIPVEARLGRVEQGTHRRGLLFGIIRDITAQVSAEQHLRRAERLASLGTLLGGVAHELNNPLSAVLGFADILLMDERPAEEREDLRTIRREAERMAKIVSDLRLLARDTQEGASAARERVDLNDIVAHVVRTRQYSLRTRNVELHTDLASELPFVRGDRGQIEQVLLNLVVNAEQALMSVPGERRLILRTRATATGASLHVVDNGPGIPVHLLERIFDPFFTTKAPGEGTGLGLSLVHSIVSEHGGEIRVDSEAGAGAAFRIDLPRADAAFAAPAAAQPGAAAGTALRILVVDDEDSVRRVVSRFLRGRGHHVDEASDGRAALDLLESTRHAAPFDVIVSDLRMPGLGGDELLTRLREAGDGMDRRLVFFSGDTASAEAARVLGASRVPVLAKPISLSELARAVESMQDHPGED
jgi:hypothetical protein